MTVKVREASLLLSASQHISWCPTLQSAIGYSWQCLRVDRHAKVRYNLPNGVALYCVCACLIC